MAELIPVRKRGRPKRTEEFVDPTPETRAKLQRDQVSDLLKQGELSPDQERAARKIHSFSLALQRGMFPQSRIRSAAPGPSKELPQAPLERLSEHDDVHWSRVYRPWAGAMRMRIVSRQPPLSSFRLVDSIVNENFSPDRVSAQYGLPKERILNSLRLALDSYNSYKREKNSL